MSAIPAVHKDTLVRDTSQNKVTVHDYSNQTTGRYIYSVFHSLLTISAIYLSVRCNGYKVSSILIAFFCPYFYIIYSIIQYNGLCEKHNNLF
jgi:hypothetical protein